MLVSLPYTLLSMTNDLHTISRSLGTASKPDPLGKLAQGENTSTSIPLAIGPDILSTCVLTSGVLLLVGGTSKTRGMFSGGTEAKPGAMGHRRTGSIVTEAMTMGGARKILARSFSVGLPFYATSKLGGVQTGLVMSTAVVADLTSSDDNLNLSSTGGLKRLLKSRRWTIAAILLQAVCDLVGLTSTTRLTGSFTGLLALCLSVTVLPPPFPTYNSKKTHITSPAEAPPSSGSSILTTLKEIPASSSAILPDPKVSSLTYNPEDAGLTLVAGALTGTLTLVLYSFSSIPSAGAFSTHLLAGGFLTICTAALSLTLTQPQSLRQSRGTGLLLGSLFSCSLLAIFGSASWPSLAYQCALVLICSAATVKDTQSSHSASHHTHGHGHGHSHHSHPKEHSGHHDDLSRFSKYVLNSSQKWPLLHSILAEKDSRRIFYFMMYTLHPSILGKRPLIDPSSLNFAFMLVQTFYGMATGSLGLLSDSIHMFFDCLALVVGLCAAVMSKWPPSTRFPYGFGKMDTLAGFANGIFLM